MAKYDLTQTIATYLDRHLVFPLIEFLKENRIYGEKELLSAQLDLLSKTNMVDFAMDIHRKLHENEPPADYKTKRETVLARLKELNALCSPLVRLLQDQTKVAELKNDKNYNIEYIQQNLGVPAGCLDHLYESAKFQFECGNYSGAADFLYHFRTLSNDAEKKFNALWGKFAAEILMLKWTTAIEDLKALKEAIEAKVFKTPLVQLQQRTWLIHWSLFVFFNHPNGRNGIVDMFLQDKYLNTIQTTCPHILRYLTTAVITNKRRRNQLNDLVRVLQQETHSYKDPITEFLEDLYANFDFDAAQKKLRECENVLMNDFFLVSCRNEFMENARLLIFETYCRIHQTIDISTLAQKLDMDQDAAERWIVNLIRNAHLDAKIDSAANHVIMGTQNPSIYQQVIDKTKSLSFRTHVLANNLEKYVQSEGADEKAQA
jgi:translation initiation factor 3 subunit E